MTYGTAAGYGAIAVCILGAARYAKWAAQSGVREWVFVLSLIPITAVFISVLLGAMWLVRP